MKRRERKRQRKRCITGLIDKAIFKMVKSWAGKALETVVVLF
jgi:hypothetical protein